MLVIISISTLLAGLAVVLLQSLLTADRVAKEAQERAAVFGRLADDFRRDVHAARKAEAAESTLTLQDFSPAADIRRVRYEVHANEVLRLEEGENGRSRRESYFLPDHASATFRRKTEGAARLIELVPLPPKQPSPESSAALGVEASLGGDRRFEK